MGGVGVGQTLSTAARVKPGRRGQAPGGWFPGWLELSFNSSLGGDSDWIHCYEARGLGQAVGGGPGARPMRGGTCIHAVCVPGFGLVWVLCVVVCPVWLSGVVCVVVWAKGNRLQNGSSIGIHGIHARGARVCAESLRSRPPLCTLEDNKSAKGVECSWLPCEFTLHVTWTQSGVYDGSASEHELSICWVLLEYTCHPVSHQHVNMERSSRDAPGTIWKEYF